MSNLKFSDLKQGDVVFEDDASGSLEVEVLTDPIVNEGKWTFDGRTVYGTVHYLMTEGLAHYGPQLSREPRRSKVISLPTLAEQEQPA